MNSTGTILGGQPRAVALTNKLMVVLGNGFSKAGWAVFAMGMVFVWAIGADADYSSLYLFRGKLENATGLVTSVTQTHFSEGGKGHHQKIYAYNYNFSLGGTNYAGISYCARSGGDGVSATMEYPVGRPDCSRIIGMRHAPLAASSGIVLVVAPVGFVFILIGFFKGMKNVKLVASGTLTRGRLLSKTPTNVSVNKQRVYKFIFQFTDGTGQLRQAVGKTHHTQKLEDEPLKAVVYDPQNTLCSVVADCLPGKQRFAADGELLPNSIWSVIPVTLMPAIALIVVVGGFWLKFVRK